MPMTLCLEGRCSIHLSYGLVLWLDFIAQAHSLDNQIQYSTVSPRQPYVPAIELCRIELSSIAWGYIFLGSYASSQTQGSSSLLAR
jgi:hypothetical protein